MLAVSAFIGDAAWCSLDAHARVSVGQRSSTIEALASVLGLYPLAQFPPAAGLAIGRIEEKLASRDVAEDG